MYTAPSYRNLKEKKTRLGIKAPPALHLSLKSIDMVKRTLFTRGNGMRRQSQRGGRYTYTASLSFVMLVAVLIIFSNVNLV